VVVEESREVSHRVVDERPRARLYQKHVGSSVADRNAESRKVTQPALDVDDLVRSDELDALHSPRVVRKTRTAEIFPVTNINQQEPARIGRGVQWIEPVFVGRHRCSQE